MRKNRHEDKTIHFAAHEVYLSFNDDEDGELFRDWWDNGDGPMAFENWKCEIRTI